MLKYKYAEKKIKLYEKLKLVFLKNRSEVLFKNLENDNCLVIKMPFVYLYKIEKNKFSFFFFDKTSLRDFLQNFSNSYKRIKVIYYHRLRLLGLGYRLRKISLNLFRFFFSRVNYIYFHVPKEVIMFNKRRRFLLLSYNLGLLKKVVLQILSLKKLIPYRLRGIFARAAIHVKKKGKKATFF